MNMLLHGVENPDIRYRDSLAQTDLPAAGDDTERYSLVLANPPFAGSLDYESTARDLQQVVKTKKTELLFLALFLRPAPDRRPRRRHRARRRTVRVEQSPPDPAQDSGRGGRSSTPLSPYPPASSNPTPGSPPPSCSSPRPTPAARDDVWFYDMQADGYSLDDKRTPQPEKSDLADILARWRDREAERNRARTDQSFFVPKAEIADNDYDLSINRYREVEYEAVKYDPPRVILRRLAAIEDELQHSRAELERLL